MPNTTVQLALVAFCCLALSSAAAPKCVKNMKRCSLYDDTCCAKQMCTLGPSCTTTALGTQKCSPVCVREDKHDMRKVMIGNYIAWETGSKKAPGLLVLQEWWGVNEAIKQAAEHLAHQGYRTLIPDLYQGTVPLNTAEARQESGKLNWTVAIRQFVEGVAYLRRTGSKKVGVVGFCQGGGLAFCAAQYANVDAAVPFYGSPNRTFCQPENIKVPVQMHVGQNDTGTLAGMNATYNAIMAAGHVKDVTLYTYPNTPHAFLNGLTEAGRQLNRESNRTVPLESVTLAFARTTAFLAKYLRGKA